MLVELSVHYVGQHVIRRLFTRHDVKHKQRMAQKFVDNIESLTASKEGRGMIAFTHADTFLHRPLEWKQLMVKQVTASSLLVDVVGKSPEVQSSTKSLESHPRDEDVIPDEAAAKRKRKRKRPNKTGKVTIQENGEADSSSSKKARSNSEVS